jgi:hypothetical protein
VIELNTLKSKINQSIWPFWLIELIEHFRQSSDFSDHSYEVKWHTS